MNIVLMTHICGPHQDYKHVLNIPVVTEFSTIFSSILAVATGFKTHFRCAEIGELLS